MQSGIQSSLSITNSTRLKRISGYNEVFLRNESFPIGLHTCIYIVLITKSFTAKFIYYEPLFDPQNHILPSYYELKKMQPEMYQDFTGR